MAALSAYLSYHDAPAAIDSLEAIGFRVVTHQPGDDGAARRAQLRGRRRHARDRRRRLHDPTARGQLNGQRALPARGGRCHDFRAAVDAGATGVLAPETTEWGTERARVLDPEGHEWSFGTYQPGRSW
jgi:hypothetical protein